MVYELFNLIKNHLGNEMKMQYERVGISIILNCVWCSNRILHK